MEERHIFGSGFAVHETLEPYIKEFNPVSERIAVLRVDTKPLNIVLVCTHAPTKTGDKDFKDAFYEELAHTYDNLPGNVIKLVVGDLNAKCEREIQFKPTIGSESLHETNHFLVVAKFELKLQSRKQLEKGNSRKINLEMLKDEEIQQKYSKSIGEYVKSMELNNIDEDWDKVSKAIKQIAVESIGMIRNKKKKWYNENCRKAIRKRQTARENYIKEYKKRKYLSEILQEAERNCSMESVRNFFKTIKQYKTFNPSLKTIKNRHGVILMDPKEKADRWKEYFTELLNADIQDNSTRRKNIHGAEPMVSEVTREEVNEAIKDLKNWKSPAQLKEDLGPLKIEFGGQYVD
ncbi:hypothetical protein QTP88_002308 [Uroleucon formosanum]